MTENSIVSEIQIKGLKEPIKHWSVSVYYGWSEQSKREVYFVELTSKKTQQKETFTRAEFVDRSKGDTILGKLNEIGIAKPSYMGSLIDLVNDLIDKDQVINVNEDLSKLLNLDGQNALMNKQAIARFYLENKEKFPTKTSNSFDMEEHYGAVLDLDDKGKKYEDGMQRVAFMPSALRQVIDPKGTLSDNNYRVVIMNLIRIGVIEGKASYDDTDYTSKKAPRLNKEKALATNKIYKVYTAHLPESYLKELSQDG